MASGKVERLLFIVSRGRGPLYESLCRTFDGDDTVQVILDRRVTERRRRRPGRRTRERRQADRRAAREIDRQLRTRGYAVLGVPTVQRAPAAALARKAR
ncbi:MAG: hypothetical protein A3D33_13710 [Candidatus Rokubacteria bacterium RIFCSPHIGHO2_02_FULL_73_26]|nr:MAG: hypothetical protein A3D33_13710 [Candidatus Rokubacteria bacterium RIFCSPHIGHO2_02_FULL_73_26]OGL22772.1 MAG: hypothetical protein A3G44_15970 [Candidatus Rokubacteria bacterium RIFCSPLOWO2_12_FULL_73_47]